MLKEEDSKEQIQVVDSTQTRDAVLFQDPEMVKLKEFYNKTVYPLLDAVI